MASNVIINVPMTIDLLILSTLASGGSETAGSIADRWGEDRRRVFDWLDRFKKQGLVTARVSPSRGRSKHAELVWKGDKAKIAAYIESRKSRY